MTFIIAVGTRPPKHVTPIHPHPSSRWARPSAVTCPTWINDRPDDVRTSSREKCGAGRTRLGGCQQTRLITGGDPPPHPATGKKKMSGQTLTDRIAAAQYTLTGSEVCRAVCKATTHEQTAPKKKHLECNESRVRVKGHHRGGGGGGGGSGVPARRRRGSAPSRTGAAVAAHLDGVTADLEPMFRE
ncbi:unnamed protein product [Merluccius merluccius]